MSLQNFKSAREGTVPTEASRQDALALSADTEQSVPHSGQRVAPTSRYPHAAHLGGSECMSLRDTMCRSAMPSPYAPSPASVAGRTNIAKSWGPPSPPSAAKDAARSSTGTGVKSNQNARWRHPARVVVAATTTQATMHGSSKNETAAPTPNPSKLPQAIAREAPQIPIAAACSTTKVET